MKLLMIIVDSDCREELEVLLQRNDVLAYSEIPNAHGVGQSGIRMGSRAHPKTSSIFFTVLEQELRSGRSRSPSAPTARPARRT